MSDKSIKPESVTKPIQLLAAWLVGLSIIDAGFLSAAVTMESGSWERGLLVVAAILNVPGFLLAIFLLQTKFRPELQEDSFYYNYISAKDNKVVAINKIDVIESRIEEVLKVVSLVSHHEVTTKENEVTWHDCKVGLNENLPFFVEAKEALEKNGIPVPVIFGKTAVRKELDKYRIAISEEINPLNSLAILKALLNFPFDSFSFWVPYREAGEDEEIYVGGYGSDKYSVVLSDTVKRAISAAVTAADFERICSMYTRPTGE